MYVRMYACVYVYICIIHMYYVLISPWYVCTCKYLYMYGCMCAYLYTHRCVCVCVLVVMSGAFIKNLLHNHITNIKKIFFFFRRSKRQRNFSLFYFASQESQIYTPPLPSPSAHPSAHLSTHTSHPAHTPIPPQPTLNPSVCPGNVWALMSV